MLITILLQNQPGGGGSSFLILMVGMLVVFYFFIIRPQQKKQKDQKKFISEVKKGDSLSKIAKSHYGDAMKYPVIFEANKEIIKDPNLIYPGQVLRIPALEE